MRLSLLCASAALACGLALSACSSGTNSSSSLPSSDGQAQAVTRINGHELVTRLMPGVKRLAGPSCPSEYVFCIVVTPGNAGPYVSTSAGSGYELYNAAYIENKKGKIDKKFSTYFDPDPGNPTYQYIDFKGKGPKNPGNVKFSDFYCIGFSPSQCTGNTYTFIIGISLARAT